MSLFNANMIQLIKFVTLVIAALHFPTQAPAGTYQDQLTRCLVSSTSEEDKVVLMRWIVLSYAQHPEIKPVVKTQTNDVVNSQKEMAEFTTELFLKECLLEAREAARYEGDAAVVGAFKFLSQIAARSIIEDDDVTKTITAYFNYVDEEKFQREIFSK